jgi:hypothetical protein
MGFEVDYDRIVLGTGASGLAYLHFSDLKGDRESTLAIGEDDLWAKVSASNPEHVFGQPAQVVSPPPRGNAPTVPNPQFQLATDINDRLHELRAHLGGRGFVDFAQGTAKRVSRFGDLIRVTARVCEQPNSPIQVVSYLTRKIIVAVGFGPSKRPSFTDSMPQAAKDLIFSGKDPYWRRRVIGGTEYLYTPRQDLYIPAGPTFVVAVQGGSATSAWAVEKAVALDATHILWISSGFEAANPAGRNSNILREARTHRWLWLADITDLDQLPNGRLKLTLSSLGRPRRQAHRWLWLADITDLDPSGQSLVAC